MNAYGLFLTFDPDQVCASRKGLGGVWRVRNTFDLGDVSDRPLRPIAVRRYLGFDRPEQLLLTSTRPYRRGVMVNPKKIALDFVRARCAEEHKALMRDVMLSLQAGHLLPGALSSSSLVSTAGVFAAIAAFKHD